MIIKNTLGKIKNNFINGNLSDYGERKVRRFSREQLLCLLITVFLTALSFVVSNNAAELEGGNRLERNAPGEADKSYELSVGGLSEDGEKISVRVSEREYTEEEAEELFQKLMEELSVHIIGKNESLDKIDTDMVFPKKINGYSGIALSYYPSDSNLISYDGKVNNLELEESVETDIKIVLKAGNTKEEFSVPVTVYPADLSTAELIKEKLELMIKKSDEEQISESELVLPESVAGHKLSYEKKKDRSYIKIMAAGIFVVILLGLKPEQDRRKREKEIENELLLDYSEVVSKLMVYMGAGLAVRNAWIKIAKDYKKNLKSGHADRRAVYEEMFITAGELERGVPESRAYADFLKRCPQQCYMKLISLLEQERKTGDSRIRDAMELEAREAFEQRKNIAKRLGEEAGTKLMIPLMLSLITVLLIVAIPAMMTLA